MLTGKIGGNIGNIGIYDVSGGLPGLTRITTRYRRVALYETVRTHTASIEWKWGAYINCLPRRLARRNGAEGRRPEGCLVCARSVACRDMSLRGAGMM